MARTKTVTPTNKIIDIQHLTCIPRRTGVKVVDHVSFSIREGETVGLLGESGVGKTTLFRAIMGFLPAIDWHISGEIRVNGQLINNLTPKELEAIRGRQIRCVFQEPGLSLNPSIKIEKQLIQAIRAISPDLDQRLVCESTSDALKRAGINQPEDFYNRYPRELSGGQRQRVGISLSLCRPCSILLADEPSNALDSVTISELTRSLKHLKETSFTKSIFCVTHDLSVLSAVSADRVLFMDAGRLYEVGTIAEVLKTPGHEKLAEMVGLSRKINRHGGAQSAEKEFSQKTSDADKQAEPFVSIDHLSFGFKRRSLFTRKQTSVLADINLDIQRSEFVALVGSSGSGKSTIGGVLSRLLEGYTGQIRFEGMDIVTLKRKHDLADFHQKLQVVFQEPADTFDPALTMRQNLEECFFALGFDRKGVERIFNELMGMLALGESTLDEIPENLSGGQKQRFALLRAFGSDPSMIVADEPFTHLDLIAQSRLIDYMLDRKNDPRNPLSCLLISHEIGIVSRICDRIIIVDNGQVVEEGNTNDIMQAAGHPATIRLIQAANDLGTLSA